MPLSPEQIADGWIEHDGGSCPVDPDCTVSMLLGSGSKQTGWTARNVIWPHDAYIYEIGGVIPRDACVIAYRPENRHD